MLPATLPTVSLRTRHLAALLRTRETRKADRETAAREAATLDRKAHLARLLADEEAAERYAKGAATLRATHRLAA